jgi:hypothetical protein
MIKGGTRGDVAHSANGVRAFGRTARGITRVTVIVGLQVCPGWDKGIRLLVSKAHLFHAIEQSEIINAGILWAGFRINNEIRQCNGSKKTMQRTQMESVSTGRGSFIKEETLRDQFVADRITVETRSSPPAFPRFLPLSVPEALRWPVRSMSKLHSRFQTAQRDSQEPQSLRPKRVLQ